jgi:hypothetical protein
MAAYEVDIDGKIVEVDVPAGQNPATYLQHATHSIRSQMARGDESDSFGNLMGEVGRVGKNYLGEMWEGAKGAFAPKYSEPNMFDRGVGAVLGDGAADASQKYISTPVSQIASLMRAIFPMVGTGMEEARVGGDRLTRSLGGSDNAGKVVGDSMAAGAGMVMPTSGGPLNLAAQLIKKLGAGGIKPVRAAEAEGQMNVHRNAFIDQRNDEAMSGWLDQISGQTSRAQARGEEVVQGNRMAQSQSAERQAALQRQQQAEGRIASYDPATGRTTSPAADKLRNPVSNEEAYSFMNAPEFKPPTIPLTKLEGMASEITAQFEGVPKSLSPSKTGKVAEELTAADPTGGAWGQMEPAQRQQWAAIREKLQTSKSSGGMTLDKVHEMIKGLGELTHAPDPRTSGLAKKMYRETWDDVRNAAYEMDSTGRVLKVKDQAAHQLVEANKIASQNLAARDIADKILFNGSKVDKLGRLQVDPGAILRAVQKDNLLAQIPAVERAEFIDTLNQVFRVRREVPAETAVRPEIIKATKIGKGPKLESRLPETVAPQQPSTAISHWNPLRLAAGAVGHGGAAMGGIPGYLGAMGGYAAAAAYPRLIFSAAMTKPGRAFLNTLYKDAPPMLGETAKMTAISNFLIAQGKTY